MWPLCSVDFEGLPEHRLLDHVQRSKGPPRKPPSQSRLAVSATVEHFRADRSWAPQSVWFACTAALTVVHVLPFTVPFGQTVSSCCGKH